MDKSKNLRISLVQADTRFADIPGNLAHLEELIPGNHQASDLYLLPELFNTGYRNAFTTQPERMNGHTHRWMMQMAERSAAVVAGTISIRDNGKTYNRFLFVRPDGITQIYDKINVFAYSGEDKVYSAGIKPARFDWLGWNIKPIICFDLRFPESARNEFPFYDMLLCPAHWPATRMPAWDRLLPARAIENQCYMAAANRTGMEGDVRYSGHSAAIDYMGNSLSGSVHEEEGIFRFQLSSEELQNFRSSFPFLRK